MRDFQNYSITRNGTTQNNIPIFDIRCDITDSQNGEILGEIDINFPEILEHFTDSELIEIFQEVIPLLLNMQIKKNQEINNISNKIKKFKIIKKSK